MSTDMSELTGAERRRHPRLGVPFDVTVGGVTYRTENVSVGGFCLAAPTAFRPGPLDALVAARGDGFTVVFEAVVTAVFRDPGNGLTGFEFVEPAPEAARRLFAAILEEMALARARPALTG